MTSPTPHVFLTRFNLPANRVEQAIFSPEWLDERMRLFEAYTVPSVRAQVLTGVSWVVYLDAQSTPQWLRVRMVELQGELPLHPIYLDRALDREAIRAHVMKVSQRETGLVSTSNLDNDDGLATDFVQRLRESLPEEAPAALYLTRGLILSGDRVYQRQDRNNAFGAVVDDISTPGFISCWATPHNELESLMPVVRVEGAPAWLQVVHGRNVSNRVGGRLTSPRGQAARFPGLIDDLPDLSRQDKVRDLVVQPVRLARDRLLRPGAAMLRKAIGDRRYESLKMTFRSIGK